MNLEELEAKRKRIGSNADITFEERQLTVEELINLMHKKSIFLDTSHINEDQIHNAINAHKESGCEVIVAASAFSVDDPSQEISVLKCAQEDNIGATATHEISKLYGLRIRTRTAAVNASILPRMIQTANMTQKVLRKSVLRRP